MRKKDKFKIRMRKKWIIAGAAVLLAGGALCIGFVRMRGNSMSALAENAKVQTATVTAGDISTTVVGTGNLTAAEAQEVTVPAGVEFEAVMVESGDRVKKGDVLAVLDEASIQREMLAVQQEIEELDEDIQDAREDEESTAYITASVSGTVKKIYAKEDAAAADIMADNGALLILTADDGLDTEFAVTGAAGTIGEILVEKGDEVDAGDKLIYLENLSGTAEYMELVDKREERISYLQKLASAAAAGKVTASFDGIVQTMDVTANGTSDQKDSGENKETKTGADTEVSAQPTGQTAVQTAVQTTGVKAVRASAVSFKTVSFQNAVESEEPEPSETESESETETPTERISVSSIRNTLNAPVVGQEPPTAVNETEYYTGTVTWEPEDGTFAEGVSYTAEVTLQAKSGEGYQYIFPQTIAVSQDGAEILTLSVADTTLKCRIKFEKTSQAEQETEKADQAETGKQPESEAGQTEKADDSGKTPADNEKQSKETEPQTQKSSQEKSGAGSQPAVSVTGQSAARSSVSVSGGSLQGASAAASGGSVSSADSSESEKNADESQEVTAFTISPDETMLLTVNVDELDILSISEGQTADVTFEALEDQTFEGTVTSISDTATVNGGVAKYEVEIEIPGSDDMRVGMNASAVITVEEKQGILTLPAIALQERGNRTFVYTESTEDGQLSGELAVETGLSDGSSVEIVSGLEEGDTVYYTRVGVDNTESGFGRGGMNRIPGGGDMMNHGNMSDRGNFKGGGFSGGEAPDAAPQQQ